MNKITSDNTNKQIRLNNGMDTVCNIFVMNADSITMICKSIVNITPTTMNGLFFIDTKNVDFFSLLQLNT